MAEEVYSHPTSQSCAREYGSHAMVQTCLMSEKAEDKMVSDSENRLKAQEKYKIVVHINQKYMCKRLITIIQTKQRI